jgi:hypothetical protein
MNIKTMAWSFAESRSSSRDQSQSTLTETPCLTVARGEDIFILGVFADGQVVVLTKLLVAVHACAVSLLRIAFTNRVCR